MPDDELLERVRELRARGRSPKEIARALKMRPAAVTPLIQRLVLVVVARERGSSVRVVPGLSPARLRAVLKPTPARLFAAMIVTITASLLRGAAATWPTAGTGCR